jgi:hypothetical protein
VLRDLAHQLFPRARQISHLLNRRGRHEAAADQTVREQIGNPLRILDITLAPRHVANVAGVSQHEREVLFQDVPHGFPVRARRLRLYCRRDCAHAESKGNQRASRWTMRLAEILGFSVRSMADEGQYDPDTAIDPTAAAITLIVPLDVINRLSPPWPHD